MNHQFTPERDSRRVVVTPRHVANTLDTLIASARRAAGRYPEPRTPAGPACRYCSARNGLRTEVDSVASAHDLQTGQVIGLLAECHSEQAYIELHESVDICAVEFAEMVGGLSFFGDPQCS